MENCICCDKKLGFLSGSNKLAENDINLICDKCFYKFKTKLNIFERTVSMKQLELNKKDLVDAVLAAQFNRSATKHILSFIDKQEKSITEMLADKNFLQLESRDWVEPKMPKFEDRQNHMVTTGHGFHGYDIIKYCGIVSASVFFSTGLTDASALFGDLFETQAAGLSERLEGARRKTLNTLIARSVKLGGNAVVNIKYESVVLDNNMMGVVADGNSVIIEKTD